MSARPSFEVACCRDGFVIRVNGHGTLRESPGFREFVASRLDSGDSVVVDLTACDYLDSTFLGCLIGLHKRSQQADERAFAVVADQPTRVRLFATNLLDRLLAVVETHPPIEGQFLRVEFDPAEDSCQLGQHVMQCHQLLSELGGPDADRFKAIADKLAQELKDSKGSR